MPIDQGCNAGAAELTASLANELVSGRGQDQGLDRPKARALISSAAWAGGWVNKALTAVVLRLASKLRHGHLTLVLPDGSVHRFRGEDTGPAAEVRIHRPAALRRLVLALRPGGTLYASVKYGRGEREHQGRKCCQAEVAPETVSRHVIPSSERRARGMG